MTSIENSQIKSKDTLHQTFVLEKKMENWHHPIKKTVKNQPNISDNQTQDSHLLKPKHKNEASLPPTQEEIYSHIKNHKNNKS